MHTASPLYAPAASHAAAAGAHYYVMGSHHHPHHPHHRYMSQWDSPSMDPRQPRKTTLIKEDPARPCSRPQEQVQYISAKQEQDVTGTSSSSSSSSFNDGWQFGHPDLSPQGTAYELVGGAEQFWYTPARQEFDARSSSNSNTAAGSSQVSSSPNYAMYGSSRTTSVPTQDAPFAAHHDSAVYAAHAQYGDGQTHPRGRREGAGIPIPRQQQQQKAQLDSNGAASAGGPWAADVTDKGTIAAQQCLNSLFPEIAGVYTPTSEPNDTIFGRPTAGDATTYFETPAERTDRNQSSRSRGISMAASPREPYHRHHRSDASSIHSPPPLDAMSYISSPATSSPYDKPLASFDQYSDASDSDSDSAYPHMMMTMMPNSMSPPRGCVDTTSIGSPMTSKYPSPELMDTGVGPYHPQPQHHQPQHQQQYTSDPSSRPSPTSSKPASRHPHPETDMPPPETLKLITLSPDAFDRNDAWLVHYRNQSIPYKNIKLMLGLDEAESTLRGRYRTLIKPKNQRLRRPPWTEKDKELLLAAVNPDLPNIKWKQVSEHIYNNGGSYLFGSSTCKKQYNQLVAEGRAKPLSESANAGKRVRQEAEPVYQQQQQQMHMMSQQQKIGGYYGSC